MMSGSDARHLELSEQARAHRGEEAAEGLMEFVVPAAQDMVTKAELGAAVSSMKEHTLRALHLALAPLHLAMLRLHFTG